MAANGILVLGAWWLTRSPLTPALVGLIASVVALPGIRILVDTPGHGGPSARMWRSRAFSFAVGGATLCGLHVAIPYIAVAEGGSLWTSSWYTGIGVLLASGAGLLWNAAAMQAESPLVSPRLLSGLVAFHALLALGAMMVTALGYDTYSAAFTFQEHTVERVYATWSPLLAAIAAPVWALWWGRILQVASARGTSD